MNTSQGSFGGSIASWLANPWYILRQNSKTSNDHWLALPLISLCELLLAQYGCVSSLDIIRAIEQLLYGVAFVIPLPCPINQLNDVLTYL